MKRGAVLDHAFVLAGRGATGLVPVLITALASRAYGLEAMGQIATALAATYALVEVADAQSQRHVTRLVIGRDPDASGRDRAAFNGLRLLVLAPGLVATIAAVAPLAQPALMVLVLTALWAIISNTLYAEALAAGRFTLLGAVPFIPLLLLPLAAAGLDAARVAPGPWPLVLALHAARLGEVTALLARLPRPEIAFGRSAVLAQWRQTRYLMLQTLMSSIQARLLIPLVLVLSGAAGAGIFSVGISLLSVLSLVAVAITVPAYRRAVEATALEGAFDGVLAMLQRTRWELIAGVAASCAIVAGLAALTPALARVIFHVDDPAAHRIMRLIVLGGVFESLNLFAGAYYHATFRDRLLFGLSVINVVGSWLLLAAGFVLGGLAGAAAGFLASRALGCAVLWVPLLRGTAAGTTSL